MAVSLSLFAGVGAQLFSDNGVPLAGGKIYTYAAGTTTPAATYTTSAGNIANSNPIVLNAAGRVATGEIWLLQTNSYKFVLQDANSNTIATYDNVDGANNYELILADFANTSDPAKGDALVGFMQSNSSGNLTGSVGKTVHQKFQEMVSVLDFGADPTGVADSTTQMQAALTAAAGKELYVPAGTYKITNTLQMFANTRFYGDGKQSVITTALDIVMLESGEGSGILYAPLIENIRFNNSFPVTNVLALTVSATTTSGSSVVTVTSVTGLTNCMDVTGTGIPAGAKVSNVGLGGASTFRLVNQTGSPITATASGSATLSMYYQEGQTKFHIYFNNSMFAYLFNVTFTTSFQDNAYSPNNHAGLWLDRDAASSNGFGANINNCFFNHAQLLCGISDSNIKNTIIWPNPFDYGLKLSAPGITVEGCNLSAGTLKGAIWTAASVKETFGNSNHTIVGNNIDGGDVWYTAYGLNMDVGFNITIVGNRFNNIYKSGIYATDSIFNTISGNTFLNTNRSDGYYSHIEYVNSSQVMNRNTITANTFSWTNTYTNPGYIVREVNAGGGNGSANAFEANAIFGTYASPPVNFLLPYSNEVTSNVGNGLVGVTSNSISLINVTLGNGVLTSTIKITNSDITVRLQLVVGSTTTFTANPIGFVMPVAASFSSVGTVSAFRTSTSLFYMGASIIATSSVYAYIAGLSGAGYWSQNVPFTWATGDVINFQLTYSV
jgi:hypothetical protein